MKTMIATHLTPNSAKIGRRLATVLFALLLAVVAGCGGGMNISDQDLVQKMRECNAESNKTPGMAVSCGNYIEECKRRGQKSGNYIC